MVGLVYDDGGIRYVYNILYILFTTYIPKGKGRNKFEINIPRV